MLDTYIDCMIYSRALEAIGSRIETVQAEDVVVIQGFVSKRSEEEAPKIIVEDIRSINEAPALYGEELIVYLEPADKDRIIPLADIVKKYPGSKNNLVLGIGTPASDGGFRRVFVDTSVSVGADVFLLKEIEELLGAKDCWKLKADQKLPEPRKRWQGSKS